MHRRNNRISEKGQTIILVVISVMIMVVMAALVVDGGNLYLNRRQAQTAADAAALAAAYEYCIEKGSMADANTVAETYAITHNDATALVDLDNDPGNNIDITYSGGEISVAVEIEKDTFFAKILGRPTGRVEAKASANCFPPGAAENLLPIAWSCRAPEGDEDNLGTDCTVQSIPLAFFEALQDSGFSFDSDLLDEGDGSTAGSYWDGTGGKIIYVVMDSNKFDLTTCEEPQWGTGNINCDFNDDGILDVEGRGDRGWLSFDGQMGASDLKDIIEDGYPGEVTINTWYSGAPGTKATAFEKAKLRIGEVVLLPVYNAVCDTNGDPLQEKDEGEDCYPVVQPGDDSVTGPGQKKYYRVSAFAPFVITCISEGQNDFCPGKNHAGLYGDNQLKKEMTIEGYFVGGYVYGTSPGTGFDLGVYILSLTE